MCSKNETSDYSSNLPALFTDSEQSMPSPFYDEFQPQVLQVPVPKLPPFWLTPWLLYFGLSLAAGDHINLTYFHFYYKSVIPNGL